MSSTQTINDAILKGQSQTHQVFFDFNGRIVSQSFMKQCLFAASQYDDFKQTFDPYGHHSGGKLTVENGVVYFRIIHFDRSMQRPARRPIDLETSISVLLFYS
ncbi:DUF3768 domain-containing protein [uncultured Roseobacter sp.]|uniref:DUF3768 domain-containing protein n=1 Tax=uncultured Roseobacter sp. TaxID=114847 RepID=UPI00345B6521